MCLIEKFDINAVAVGVQVLAENKKVRSAKWIVATEFWHFLFEDSKQQFR